MPEASGERAVRFIETFCRHTRGKAAGQRVSLYPWQKDIVRDVLAEDGEARRYRRGLLGLPRKNGKSMLGAGLALYCLIADGEAGAEVYSCAGDREQARIVFDAARRMIELEPQLARVLRVTRDVIYHDGSGSKYRALSAEAYTKEGLNPSAVIFDEVHVQPNDGLWDVMTLGSAARDRPLVLGITTAGYDKATLCGRLYDFGRREAAYRDGAWRGNADGFFFRWWEPSAADCDYRDAAVWREANPGLASGFLHLGDFETAVQQTSENAFRRYRLNQWTSTVSAWLPFGAWDALATDQRVLAPGEACALGFDGSFSGDSTALVACTPDGFLSVIAAWERPDGPAGDGWRVPIADVEAAIVEACKVYSVREVACDPFRWQRSMQALESGGIPIVEWPTSSPARMVPATAAFYDAVIEGRISHDGNNDLARHVGNAMVKTDRLGPRIVKEHRHSRRRIDLAVAAVIAYDRARLIGEDDDGPTIW